MKAPFDIEKLMEIELPVTKVVPTIESYTKGKCVLIEMKNGNIFDYINDGWIKITRSSNNIKEFCKDSFSSDDMEDFNYMYWKSPKLTKILKTKIPNLKQVWLGNL